MGFDVSELQEAVANHGTVVRVVIAAIRGSSPREVGASMLVWKDGQSGSIGGGTLEFEAVKTARAGGRTGLSHHALGPELGQCCGGAVSLLKEVYDPAAIADLDEDVIARRVSGPDTAPMSVKRLLTQARGQGIAPEPQLIDGWMIEPVHHPKRSLWIWGLATLGVHWFRCSLLVPDVQITWVDTSESRFPKDVPDGVITVPAANPAELVQHAPSAAEHLIVTYSHTLDFELCHRLLGQEFAFAGLIGSKTKWARFRSRLAALGHTAPRIADINCPIGDPALGKHPQMIAVGVAASLLRPVQTRHAKKDVSA